MPDIRIEIPEHVAARIQPGKLILGQSIENALVEQAILTSLGAVGAELNFKPADFWGRASQVFSSADVVFVDVTMIDRPDRTPAIRKKLATAIKDKLSEFLAFGGPKHVGVLVWIHLKDPEADYAEFEPVPL